MHYLVVRQRQHEVFMEGIQQTEAQLVVVPAPVYGLLGDVAQRIVHPAHIPLEAEAQSTHVWRAAHHWPSGRLFGERQHAGAGGVYPLVDVTQQAVCRQVLSTAELVGYPFSIMTP